MLKTAIRQATTVTRTTPALSVLHAMQATSRQPIAIKASPDEVRRGRLTENNLEIAVRSVLQDGLVVVENAIDHGVLDKLNEKMVEDAKYLRSLGDKGPFNYNQGNLQQDAPPVRKYFDPSIFLSMIVRLHWKSVD